MPKGSHITTNTVSPEVRRLSSGLLTNIVPTDMRSYNGRAPTGKNDSVDGFLGHIYWHLASFFGFHHLFSLLVACWCAILLEWDLQQTSMISILSASTWCLMMSCFYLSIIWDLNVIMIWFATRGRAFSWNYPYWRSLWCSAIFLWHFCPQPFGLNYCNLTYDFGCLLYSGIKHINQWCIRTDHLPKQKFWTLGNGCQQLKGSQFKSNLDKVTLFSLTPMRTHQAFSHSWKPHIWNLIRPDFWTWATYGYKGVILNRWGPPKRSG